MTELCTHLYRNFDHEGWNDYDLQKLTLAELEFLARVMGVAFSGTKEKRIVRLLSCRIVRKELSRFKDNPSEVAQAFKRERLKWMCVQGNLWRSGNKIQLATVLLNWRNRCRHDGSRYLEACIASTRERPIQLNLQFI